MTAQQLRASWRRIPPGTVPAFVVLAALLTGLGVAVAWWFGLFP